MVSCSRPNPERAKSVHTLTCCFFKINSPIQLKFYMHSLFSSYVPNVLPTTQILLNLTTYNVKKDDIPRCSGTWAFWPVGLSEASSSTIRPSFPPPVTKFPSFLTHSENTDPSCSPRRNLRTVFVAANRNKDLIQPWYKNGHFKVILNS